MRDVINESLYVKKELILLPLNHLSFSIQTEQENQFLCWLNQFKQWKKKKEKERRVNFRNVGSYLKEYKEKEKDSLPTDTLWQFLKNLKFIG